MCTRYEALARLDTFKGHAARLVGGKIFQNCTMRNVLVARFTSLIPCLHCVKVLYSRLQFYKLYVCSIPVAIEHWLCDALYHMFHQLGLSQIKSAWQGHSMLI